MPGKRARPVRREAARKRARPCGHLAARPTQPRPEYADRYTRAVAQLGDPALEVRLGGIYALQRLEIDSSRDQPTVVNVLSAYVRDHLPFADTACTQVDDPVSHGRADVPLISNDVWAAIDVLATRDRSQDKGAVARLAGVCLPDSFVLGGRDLRGFNLAYANLDHAHLTVST